jgi:uncharacterized alpha-E superfamily protein
LRLYRAHLSRLPESPPGVRPLMSQLAGYLDDQGLDISEGVSATVERTIAMAVNAANQVRDRFSVDAWASLADLERTVEQHAQDRGSRR